VSDRSYYVEGLAAERLRQCYDLATPAVRRYMDGETAHVMERMRPGDRVLELGCGYGRIMKDLAPAAAFVYGVDYSAASLRYAAEFWEERLTWFRIQAAHGLVGEIDEDATGAGGIVCRDGFRASTFGADDFRELATGCSREATIEIVADSSIFCEMIA